MKVLLTGAKGFIGRNLAARLARLEGIELALVDLDRDPGELEVELARADLVYHLAGVNRPLHPEEFETGNAGLTEQICDTLRRQRRAPRIVMTSSIQAALDNPYGQSKRRAEEALLAFAHVANAPLSIWRLKNVFGKWCRPNYNSVTATFCHNIAHDLPITISDPDHAVELIYIDDVVEALLGELDKGPAEPAGGLAPDTLPAIRITLGELAGRIQAFHEMRTTLRAPDFAERFNQCLYATYLSYVEPRDLKERLELKTDPRGTLAEFIKSPHFGQIFLSRTHPGVTRGNHYHHTKTEKFLVVAGEGMIRLRPIEERRIIEYRVHGDEPTVVNIPPGCTHSIENIGADEMITLFWASEIYDPDHPDTYYLPV